MKRRFRLTRSVDFLRVRRSGKSYAHPLAVLIAAPNDLDQVRIGISASHAVGNAVQRNRAKRRLRACMDTLLPELDPGWDIVFLARVRSLEAPYEELLNAVRLLLIKARILERTHDGS